MFDHTPQPSGSHSCPLSSRLTLARRFLVATAIATLALWAAGSPRVIWLELARERPFDAPVTIDARVRNVTEARRLPLPDAAGVGTGATHARLGVTVTALEPRTSYPDRRPAFARIRFVGPGTPEDATGNTADDMPDDAPEEYRQTGLPAFASAALQGVPTATAGVGAIPPGTRALDLQLVVLRGTGAVRFEPPVIDFVRRRGIYLGTMAAIAALWLVLGACLLRACLRRAGTLPTGIGAAALAVVVTGVSLSEPSTAPGLTWLGAAGQASLPAFSEAAGHLFFKGGHFAAFALTGAALAMLRRPLGVTLVQSAAFLVLVALASEALQRHLPNRSASLVDVGIDAAGAALGFIVGAALSAMPAALRSRARRRR